MAFQLYLINHKFLKWRELSFVFSRKTEKRKGGKSEKEFGINKTREILYKNNWNMEKAYTEQNEITEKWKKM